MVPTERVTFKFKTSPTCTWRLVASYAAKPCLLTETLYPWAGVKAGAANTPASVLFNSRVRPRDGLVTTTFAAGTGDPEESRTVPEMAPRPAVAWPQAENEASKAKHAANTGFLKLHPVANTDQKETLCTVRTVTFADVASIH